MKMNFGKFKCCDSELLPHSTVAYQMHAFVIFFDVTFQVPATYKWLRACGCATSASQHNQIDTQITFAQVKQMMNQLKS